MLRLFKNRHVKRILASVILLQYLISAGTTEVYAYSNAKQVQQDYISLMNGAYVADLDDDIYSYDDLRNIAIFLSNSYVPFYTSLDADSEADGKQKSVSMLRQIGFSKDSAEQIVDEIYQASLDSASQVYIDFKELGDVMSNEVRFVHSVGRTKPKAYQSLPAAMSRAAEAATLVNPVTAPFAIGAGIVSSVTGVEGELALKSTTSCLVTGGETPFATATSFLKTLGNKILMAFSSAWDTVKSAVGSIGSYISSLWNKPEGVSQATYWGETASDTALCNADAIATLVGTIKSQLKESGIPEAQVTLHDMIISYGDYEYSNSELLTPTLNTEQANMGMKQEKIKQFVDVPGGMLASLNCNYIYEHIDNTAPGRYELSGDRYTKLLNPLSTMIGTSAGTIRFDENRGSLFDDLESVPYTLDSSGKIKGSHSENSDYDRGSGIADSGRSCMFGKTVVLSMKVGENAYMMFTAKGAVSGGHFVYKDVYTYSEEDAISKGWQVGTSAVARDNAEMTACIPAGTMANSGYTSTVGDDNIQDQFTPLTLYMFNCIIDNMSRDNTTDDVTNKVEKTGYRNGTQQYPIHLYYRENNQTVPCGELNDWVLEVLYYVSANSNTTDKNTGKLGTYISNGSIENFIDKTEGEVSDPEKMVSLVSLFQNMYVDWVGNILVDEGDQRVVVIPACLNPYTFTSMESNGGDSLKAVLRSSTNKAPDTWGIAGKRVSGYATHKNNLAGYKDRVTNFDGKHFEFVPMRNLVSVLGLKMINDPMGKFVTKDTDKLTFNAVEYTNQSILTMVMEKGKTGTPTWDFKFGIGTAGGDEFADMLSNQYGFIAAHAENNVWTGDNNVHLTPKAWVCEKSEDTSRGLLEYNGCLAEFMVYKQIRQSTDNSNTVFTIGSVVDWDEYASSNSFSQTGNKLKLDDNFNFNLSFTEQDRWMLQNLYLTYTIAYINAEETNGAPTYFSPSTHYVNMKFNDIFPRQSGLIEWDVTDIMDESIREFTYYLLHPTKGIAYVATWFKNKIAGIFLRIHEDIVGASDSNASTGMTKYISFSGYVTTPALGDISWISSFVDSYNDIIVYFIIIMMLIILCFVLANNITPQRGIVGFIAFAFLAFMPPALINFTIDASNKVCDWIYGQKFNYWAVVQTNEYIGSLADVEAADGTTDYIAALYKATGVSTGDVDTGGESTAGYSGVKIKWLAPKKYNELGAFSDEILEKITKSKSGLSGWTVTGLVVGQQNSNSTEFFIDSDSSTYLYRDILDIYRYGSSSYYMRDHFSNSSFNIVDAIHRNSKNVCESTFTDKDGNTRSGVLSDGYSMQQHLLASQRGAGSSSFNISGLSDASSLTYVRKGFLLDTPSMIDQSGNVSNASKNYFDTAKATSNLYMFGNSRGTCALQLVKDNYDRFISSYKSGNINITVDGICNTTRNQATAHGCNFGIDQDYFKFGINELISGDHISSDRESFYQYALYTESPYYFFSYNIRDHAAALHGYNYEYSSSGLIQNTNMYHMLLDDNQAYFFNYNVESGDGYGELRDFMNFHDMFYYIVPALSTGNDLVNAWANLYGMTPTTDISLRLDTDGYITFNGTKYDNIADTRLKDELETLDSESLYNFWLNYNIRTIYNCYTPWLYAMQSCDYATKPETIHVAGEKYVVQQPMNPYSYYDLDANGNMIRGRYMVFSRSEMKYYGLLESDLTEVERKLLAIEDEVYARAIELMNYYTICDETFIQSFALMETFAFNKEFSETGAFSSSFPLYPQTYELKAFTYDAYLRMIVAGSMEENSDGERLQASTRNNENKSIYERVQENTSIFFSIILIISDLIAVYVIPTLKIFFICMLFFVSILVIISAVTGIENASGGILQAFWKSLFAPLVSFFAISVGMAFVIALFMSNGSDNITSVGYLPRIALGDPTTTILAVTIINTIACIMYFKVIKKMFSDLKTYFKTVFDNIGAAVTGAVKKVGGLMIAGRSMKALKNLSNGTAFATGTAKTRGIDNVSPKPKAVGTNADGNGSGGNGGSGGSGALDAAAGVAGGALGRTAADKVIDAYQKEPKQSKEDKQLDKIANREAKLNKEREQLENRKKDGIIGDKNYAKQKARLEKKNSKNDKKLDRLTDKVGAKDDRAKAKAAFKQNKANNVAKYGRLGAIKANTKLTADHIKSSANSRAQGAAKSLGRMKGDVSNGVTSVKKGASSIVSGAKSVSGKVQKFATNGHYRERVVDSAKGAVVSGAQRATNSVKNVAKGAASSASQIASDARTTYKNTSRAEMSSATRSRIIDRKTGRNSTRKS